jgi:hypothetical protein
MIRTILDKIMIYGSDEDKETISNILSLKLTDLQVEALLKLEAEIDDYIETLQEPPDERDIAKLHPVFCEGCEE